LPASQGSVTLHPAPHFWAHARLPAAHLLRWGEGDPELPGVARGESAILGVVLWGDRGGGVGEGPRQGGRSRC
jgi:hypothetical protein